MDVSILGLGYVGCVSAACLARDGHHIVGVDVNPAKVRAVQRGNSPIIEPELEALIQAGVASGRLEATGDTAYAIDCSELVMICVGTPSRANGSLELGYVERVCRDIGRVLASKEAYTVIVVRSTVLPGSAQERLIPLLEAESGKKAGSNFGFCVNPEFLREGSAITDFDHPPYTIIGQLDEQSGEWASQLYAHVDAPLYRVPLGVAEMAKYASNAFHALKVVFANEVGNVCQAHGIDSHQVMDIFVRDTKLNLSPAYLKPGFAFGGSCLGKDLRALLYAARQRDVRVPVLQSILPSNQLQVQKAVDILLREGRRKVSIIGLSFKPSTDDLRESPAIDLVERLLGKGFDLHIYDREVSLGRLHGSNRAYVDQVIPHVGSLMRSSMEEVVGAAEVVVVTKRLSCDEQERLLALLRPSQMLIDLVRLDGQKLKEFKGQYRGIGW
jgi:GDP-mannose 6-dehydrogenase